MPPILRVALLSLLALPAACNSPTEVEVLVDGPKGLDSLTVTLFDNFGQVGTRTVAQPTLPGAINVSGLKAPAALLVVATATGGLVDAQRVTTQPGGRVDVKLTLAMTLKDADGDGVPDNVDDCPATADPDQKNSDGMNAGDACANANPDGGVVCPAAFCEDFEGTVLDDTKWKTNFSGGSANIDSTQHHNGLASLRSSNDAVALNGIGAGGIFERKTLTSVPNMFIRAFVLVPSGFAMDPAAIIKVQQTNDMHHGITLQLEGRTVSIYNDLPATPSYVPPSGAFAYDTWFCLEWQVQVGSKTGTSRVWIDGTELGDLNVAQDTSLPGVDQVAFGLVAFGTQPIAARKLWIDDIAIGATQVGCKN